MTTVSLAEIEASPERYERLPNGVWRDKQSGQIARAAESTTKLTPADSQQINRKRWDLARAAAAEGLASVKGTDYETIKHIFAKQAGLAGDTSRGRASTHAAEFVMVKGGYTPDRAASSSTVTHNTLNIVDGRPFGEIARIIRDQRQPDQTEAAAPAVAAGSAAKTGCGLGELDDSIEYTEYNE